MFKSNSKQNKYQTSKANMQIKPQSHEAAYN